MGPAWGGVCVRRVLVWGSCVCCSQLPCEHPGPAVRLAGASTLRPEVWALPRMGLWDSRVPGSWTRRSLVNRHPMVRSQQAPLVLGILGPPASRPGRGAHRVGWAEPRWEQVWPGVLGYDIWQVCGQGSAQVKGWGGAWPEFHRLERAWPGALGDSSPEGRGQEFQGPSLQVTCGPGSLCPGQEGSCCAGRSRCSPRAINPGSAGSGRAGLER